MDMRRIGSLTVSAVGLGCNNFGGNCDAATSARVVDSALDAGINLFDTADYYCETQSEQFLGQALRGKRDKAVIATKFGLAFKSNPASGGASARWIATAVEDSLRRLGTDRIDLYQIHFPDTKTPIGETLEALDRLVKAGKVREIGNSNFAADQIDEAAKVAADKGFTPFISAQNHLNLLKQDTLAEIGPACARHKLAILPYFPLQSGVLTGKYRRGSNEHGTRFGSGIYSGLRGKFLTDAVYDTVDALEAFAKARGHSLLELAFGWLLAEPMVASVIAGATKPEQVRTNAAAATWRLTPEEAAEAARIARNGR